MSLSKLAESEESLEQKAIEEFIFESIDDFVQEPLIKKKRGPRAKIDYWQTNWGRWLRNPEINNPKSKLAKMFQLRFRVPFILFNEQILKMCKTDNLFDMTYEESKNGVPIEFKILLSLRILGRGNYYDDINELSSVPHSSIPYYFHTFVKRFAILYYDQFIRMPGEASLKERMAHYAALGLGGAMGSLDCTRLWWNHCPKWLRNLCIGKEGFPTLAFLLCCDHNRNIIHVSRQAYLGSLNDINIAKIDPFILDLLGGKYQNVEFTLLKADGTRTQCYGAYLISDNGFIQTSVFIDPIKARFNQSEIFWSEWLESVRKDVECVFGILKTRFRILMNRINLHHASTVRDVFVTCCILHNMINMFNDAIANPLYEIDPNISDDIFLAWEPAVHGSWEQYVTQFNIHLTGQNLSIRDLVASEDRLAHQIEGELDNHLPLSLFQPSTQIESDLPIIEDSDLLEDDLLSQLRVLDEAEDYTEDGNSRDAIALRNARRKFFGNKKTKNYHQLRIVYPENEHETINNPPGMVGMLNSLPSNPFLAMPVPMVPSIALPIPRRTVQLVKGHAACLSISSINQRILQYPWGPYPTMKYEGTKDYDRLRQDLIESFTQQYNMGLVIRPIRLGKKTSLPVFIERQNFDLQTCLVRIRSEFKSFNPETGLYDISIGLGLTSSRNIPTGHKIIYFVGEVLEVDSEEFNERVAKGHTGYMIELGPLFVMDCYNRRDICKASMINSWKRIAMPDSKGRPILAQQNSKIVCDLANHIVSIEATRNIIRFEEIFCEYGKDFGI